MINLTMTAKEAKIFVDFLQDYGDRLGNDGCNDWYFPDDWTLEEIRAYVEEFHIANRSNKDDRECIGDGSSRLFDNHSALYVFEKRIKNALKSN